MPKLIIRYVKFLGTSIVGSLVDTLVLWLLSDLVFKGGYWGEYVISPLISFQCAVAANFVISYFYVWKDRTRARSDASAKRFSNYTWHIIFPAPRYFFSDWPYS